MSLGRLISWCFFWAPARWFVFCLVFCLFSAFSDETQVWLGDLRVVVCWWFRFCCRCGLICRLTWTNCVLYTNSFHCLCSCEQVSVRHRPNSRKKRRARPPRLRSCNVFQRGNIEPGSSSQLATFRTHGSVQRHSAVFYLVFLPPAVIIF